MAKLEEMGEVATRLQGLRDALNLTTAQVADACGITEETYVSYESGKVDIPISFLLTLSRQYDIELQSVLFDEDPKMNSYFITRKDKGVGVERTKAYKYQSLASGFRHRLFDPMLVKVEPNDAEMTLNTHSGQEWNYVTEGRMELQVGNNKLILECGDSIMFDASRPHGMKALDGKTVKFIAIIS